MTSTNHSQVPVYVMTSNRSKKLNCDDIKNATTLQEAINLFSLWSTLNVFHNEIDNAKRAHELDRVAEQQDLLHRCQRSRGTWADLRTFQRKHEQPLLATRATRESSASSTPNLRAVVQYYKYLGHQNHHGPLTETQKVLPAQAKTRTSVVRWCLRNNVMSNSTVCELHLSEQYSAMSRLKSTYGPSS